MGGFLEIGNSSAKTDRGNQLGGINADWNVYNQGMPLAVTQSGAGQGTTAQGVSGLEAAKQHYQDILNGGPAAMRAAQPAVSAITSQADAAKAQQAEFGTARGGGTSGANQQIETNKETGITNAIAGQEAPAAQGLASVSGTETQVGNQQLQQALESLGLSSSVAQEIINSSAASRSTSLQANPLNGVGAGLASTVGSSVDGGLSTILGKALTAMGL